MRDSLLRPLVTKLKPWVSIATPVRWMCSSTYLTKKTKQNKKDLVSDNSVMHWWRSQFCPVSKTNQLKLYVLLFIYVYWLTQVLTARSLLHSCICKLNVSINCIQNLCKEGCSWMLQRQIILDRHRMYFNTTCYFLLCAVCISLCFILSKHLIHLL